MNDHQDGLRHPPPIGVLLTNMGTPEAPTPAALRRYLAEFLWDPRIVEMPRLLWWLILHGRILRTRPRRSAQAYQSIWTERGSPLLVTTLKQGELLQRLLGERLPGPVRVEVAMRYGAPSIGDGLERLRRAGCDRILVLPLYPQYSATTTGSTFDAVTAALTGVRRVPELRFVAGYHDDAGYVRSLANSIREQWERRGTRPDRLLFSFHGIPRKGWLDGDPYPEQCHATARLVARQLGLDDEAWQVAFQSRFGRAEWVTPYTDETLRGWGEQGVAAVDVICPGFAADCLETLEEIGEENRRRFLEAGGRSYHYIPALNTREDHMEALAALARRHMRGWVDAREGD
ncbi:MAG TPA: ferrochelatase [Gammaproteobacteria bacterium]|nr:ferrochelatase [Gammaproteobacteria bacterium]